MLRHLRRHGQDCGSFGKGRDCPSRSKKKCPFRVEGRHAGTRWHQSLRTNDERTAIRLVNRIIETGRLEFDEPRTAGVTVRQAIEGFLAEEASRGMADSTLKSSHPHSWNLRSIRPSKRYLRSLPGLIWWRSFVSVGEYLRQQASNKPNVSRASSNSP